jgi:hypothetical protein
VRTRDREREREQILHTQRSSQSLCRAAAEKSAGVLPGRQPLTRAQPCAKRGTTGYSHESDGTETGRVERLDGESGGRRQRVGGSRGEHL